MNINVVVGIKTDPVPVSINYSYDFAIWEYSTRKAIQYGTVKDKIYMYEIRDNEYSLRENSVLFFKKLLKK